MINIIASSRYKINRKKIRIDLQLTLTEKGISQSDVLNIVFVGKNKMKFLVNQYKHEKEALPVLSFAYHGEKIDEQVMIGDVIICYPLMVLLSAERNKKVEDMIYQLAKHGVDNLLNKNVLS